MKIVADIPVIVSSSTTPAVGVRELELARPNGTSLPPFTPGSSIVIKHAATGFSRQYSLISAPEERSSYRIAIRRVDDGRGASMAFHDDLSVGEELTISAPLAGMTLDDAAAHHVFIAGGIGVTPVIGMLHALPERATATVHYCIRSIDTGPYIDVLRDTVAELHIYDQSRGEVLDVATVVPVIPEDATIYHCGPAGLMAAVDAAAEGREPHRVRSESFGGTTVSEHMTLGQPFSVEMARSGGRVVQVGEDETMLRALLREKVVVDYSCEMGECGTCLLEYTAGDVEHCDSVLDDEERQEMLAPCVSRGRGRIVIDL